MVGRCHAMFDLSHLINYCNIPNIFLITSVGWIQLANTAITYHSFMRSNHLLHTLLAIVSLSLFSLHLQAHPRLTVVVVVDGMTPENIASLRPYMTAGGLRTLSEEAYQTAISFPHIVNGGQETTATLMTGTTPSYHGIMADTYFSRMYRHCFETLQDDNAMGIGTYKKYSPRALLSTTISDEWRLRYGTDAKIYAIGLQPQSTIIMAGHGANSCCWLDEETRKWVTTSWYPEGLPTDADAMNINGSMKPKIESFWTPRMDIGAYTTPTPEEVKRKTFRYSVKDHLLHSPIANTLVIDLAINMQINNQLGEDLTPDILFIQLTTISPKTNTDAIRSAEQEDMYLGINQDLGRLMEQLNQRVGKANYQLLLVGRPIKGHAPETYEKAGIPIQQFNLEQATALISTYLMAMYGHERWVDGGYGPFIYLNRTIIEQKRLSLENIQRQVANFLMDFEGVHAAYPIHEAIITESAPSIYRKNAGDVYYQLQEHWQLNNNAYQTYDNVIQTNPAIPLFFWSGTSTIFPDGKMQATDIKSFIINKM